MCSLARVSLSLSFRSFLEASLWSHDPLNHQLLVVNSVSRYWRLENGSQCSKPLIMLWVFYDQLLSFSYLDAPTVISLTHTKHSTLQRFQGFFDLCAKNWERKIKYLFFIRHNMLYKFRVVTHALRSQLFERLKQKDCKFEVSLCLKIQIFKGLLTWPKSRVLA